MSTLTKLFKSIMGLANVLRGIVENEKFTRVIGIILKYTRHTEYGKSGIGLTRDLINCMYELEENAKSLLVYSNLGLQKERGPFANVNEHDPFSDYELMRIKSDILSELNMQNWLTTSALYNKNVFVDESCKENVPSTKEIRNDTELADYVFALGYIINSLKVIHEDILENGMVREDILENGRGVGRI